MKCLFTHCIMKFLFVKLYVLVHPCSMSHERQEVAIRHNSGARFELWRTAGLQICPGPAEQICFCIFLMKCLSPPFQVKLPLRNILTRKSFCLFWNVQILFWNVPTTFFEMCQVFCFTPSQNEKVFGMVILRFLQCHEIDDNFCSL